MLSGENVLALSPLATSYRDMLSLCTVYVCSKGKGRRD